MNDSHEAGPGWRCGPAQLCACCEDAGVKYDPEQYRWTPMSVAELGHALAGRPARWWLSGGWAIDHWLGRTTREHGDLDVSTLRPDLPRLLAALPRLEPLAAIAGHLHPLADRADDPELRNIWLRDADRWVLQVNLEPGDDRQWRYRRDPRLTLPWDRAVVAVQAIPTGSPVTQLLWKSRGPRARDEHDLDVIHDRLDPADRRWLRDAVRLAHPHSPWAQDVRLTDPPIVGP